MIETELGNLRRTHYSKELDPSKDGSDVTVMGWVLSVRGHGNISFVTIRDKLGEIQIVAKAGNCPDDIREKISKLKEHSSIGISGMVKSSEKAPNGVEIIPKELRVFSEVEKIPPFEPQAKTVKNIDTRLEVRPIDLRRKVLRHIFLARSLVLKSIFYYNKEAFLAQSPQLYKEQLTMSFEKVFEIAPIFRAEPSRTNRHLAEAISIDFEEAFVDYGVPPHAGCGMGLERLMMALTGTENIRDTTFYPRDVDRLTP